LEGGYSAALDDRLGAVAQRRYKAEGLSLTTMMEKFLTEGQRERITFIKTDCEGYDKQIIRAARDFLIAKKPTLFLEWFDWFTPEDDADFFDAIEEVQYVALNPQNLLPVSRDGSGIPDVLCVHRTLVESVSPA
jgi:hypothetical protein